MDRLVHALVTSKLDFFNSLYSGLPVCQIMKLQRVKNAAARQLSRIHLKLTCLGSARASSKKKLF